MAHNTQIRNANKNVCGLKVKQKTCVIKVPNAE